MRTRLFRNSDAQQASHLIILFAGWSARPECFAAMELPSDTDLLVCYDYRDMTLTADLSRYQCVDLVAWSLGVWVANHLFPTLHAKWGRCIAINGTLAPIDDLLGIPKTLFAMTLENVTDDGVYRFNRRICGSKTLMSWYDSLPKRDAAELKAELQHLYDSITEAPLANNIPWTKAYISDSDKIFPPDNMESAWSHFGVTTSHIDAPHYPFNTLSSWTQILS
jgi:biotin synthesis protein BioG